MRFGCVLKAYQSTAVRIRIFNHPLPLGLSHVDVLSNQGKSVKERVQTQHDRVIFFFCIFEIQPDADNN